ncbi:Cna B-type domain-containing protein [Edaphobacillus lindanitolerans]|uniref:LPXTG-motif cell wall anchor domain-containing protein n=1 Tax=Edaphobacillus lindanitolerans TaxID=550447 RepID=A0A1U7PNV4_9BACI|nr:Cna B-type domain-containing protein [Edaphobacillus lindanitolerans]SIT73961.1 LPXTG-motif cell wall anchor domain-containing protein [Edaphobacillus lindanitolerans]
MPKLKGLSALLCVLLIVQLAVPLLAGPADASGGTGDAGRVSIGKLGQTPDSLTWRVTINASGTEHEGLQTALTLGPGLSHGTLSGEGDSQVTKTPDGWKLQTPPGSTSVTLDLKAAIADPAQEILKLQAAVTFPDGVFKSVQEAAALKPEVQKEEPPAVKTEEDAKAEDSPEAPSTPPKETSPPEKQPENGGSKEPPPATESGKPDGPSSPSAPKDETDKGSSPAVTPSAPGGSDPQPGSSGTNPALPEGSGSPSVEKPERPPLVDSPPPLEPITPIEKPVRPVADSELNMVEPGGATGPLAETAATPQDYEPDADAIIVPTTIEGVSTNTHTRPFLIWVNDGIVHVAVKSTHGLEYMDLNGVRNIGANLHPVMTAISVQGNKYNPDADLKGNTKDSRWTVFKFNASALSLEDDVHIPFFIKGIGGGHDVGDKLVLTIPHQDITANKVWAGGTERPAVKLQLKAQAAGEAVRILGTGTVTGKETPAWTYTWAKVPQNNPYGKAYVFSADEETVPPNYKKTISGLTVTNTYNPEQRAIRVEKRWIGPAAESVTIKLLADGKNTGKAIVLNEANGWTGSFEVNRFDDKSGNPIVYNVEELSIPGYRSAKTGSMDSGFIFTNTNTSKTEVKVAKEWVGPKAGPVTVSLKADGQPTGQTLTLNESSEWKGIFTDLPKHDPETGQPIRYSIEETEIPTGYEATYSTGDDGVLIVTNTAQAGSITVLKVDESDNPLPGAVFELHDSEGRVLHTDTTGDDGKIVFADLLLGDYTIVETKAPAGYRLSTEPIEIILKADSRNILQKVVNSKLGWELPDTGGLGTGLFYGGGALLMAAGLLLFRRREK